MHHSTIAVLGTSFLAALAVCRPSTNIPNNDIGAVSEGTGNHAAKINIHTAKLARTIATPSDGTSLPASVQTGSGLTPRKNQGTRYNSYYDFTPAYRPGLGKRRKLSDAAAKKLADAKQKKKEEQEINNPAADQGLGR